MNQRERNELDRYITGNYGENQFSNFEDYANMIEELAGLDTGKDELVNSIIEACRKFQERQEKREAYIDSLPTGD